jgi:hypothetical protein
VPIDHLSRSGDNEQSLAVLFELRALVCLEGILDGQLVEAKLSLELPEQIEAWLMQPDPDHMTGAARPLTRVLDRDLGHTSPA